MIGITITWVRMQCFGPSSRLMTIDGVNALMVFKSVRGSQLATASTCLVGTQAWLAKQDHPAYIPRSAESVADGYVLLPAAHDASAPGTFQPRSLSLRAAPPPIGLTAADSFAGGEVSRAASRVR